MVYWLAQEKHYSNHFHHQQTNILLRKELQALDHQQEILDL
tara:strand:+ start:191 stop:313 length:123 start_codon:yes stop_codon:yes gene_type:complete